MGRRGVWSGVGWSSLLLLVLRWLQPCLLLRDLKVVARESSCVSGREGEVDTFASMAVT